MGDSERVQLRSRHVQCRNQLGRLIRWVSGIEDGTICILAGRRQGDPWDRDVAIGRGYNRRFRVGPLGCGDIDARKQNKNVFMADVLVSFGRDQSENGRKTLDRDRSDVVFSAFYG